MKTKTLKMFEDTDPTGVHVLCNYLPDSAEFEVIVSASGCRTRQGRFHQSFTPTFGMDVTDQSQAFTLADELAAEIDAERKTKSQKTALIIVDVQKDFCAGGALAVKDGDAVVAVINQLLSTNRYDVIVSTQDYHPRTHKSFASNNPGKAPWTLGELGGQPQVMWPDHCVQGTPGAEFHPQLKLEKIQKNFPKGTNPEIDSYSGFFDNDHRSSTGLAEYLRSQGVEAVEVVGLALDYCVKATALDAVKEGFQTTVLQAATRAVNLSPGNDVLAVEELRTAGVEVK